MSYIRSWSNDDHLYVYLHVDGYLHFSWKNKNPKENPHETKCKLIDFKKLCRYFNYDINCIYTEQKWKNFGSISIREATLNNKTNKPIKNDKINMFKSTRYSLQLKIRNKIIELQPVTLQYLFLNFCRQEEQKENKYQRRFMTWE